PDPHEDGFAARIGLDGEEAEVYSLLHPVGVPLDDDKRHPLAGKFVRDNPPHASETADDEMPLELVEHVLTPSAAPAVLQVSFDYARHEEGERIEDGGYAHRQHDHREELPRSRHRVYFAIADGGDRNDGHVKSFPRRPPLDDHVAGGAAADPFQEKDA